jgi:hypothetical protein
MVVEIDDRSSAQESLKKPKKKKSSTAVGEEDSSDAKVSKGKKKIQVQTDTLAASNVCKAVLGF